MSNATEEGYHQPAMLKEALDALDIKPNGVYVDVTFGGGGHSREILKRLNSEGRLIAFDQDPDAIANALVDDRFHLVEQNFRFLKNWMKVLNALPVDGILADLGVSSHQFDSESRGFSIRFDAQLDMRMDQKRPLTAHEVINYYDEQPLTEVLRQYGELQNARALARAIISNRPLQSSTELIMALDRFAQRGKENKFKAQLFQALRIEVNEELVALKEMLLQSVEVLKPKGRLVVISYHSLEDRIVKDFMKTGNFEGEPVKDFFGNLLRPLQPLHTKPLAPTEDEINMNPRARSARLRTAEKCE
jgi:16S rRNA (cytosine1402-N4)-methyltransferase